MNISPKLTTVTKFSKIVALILFITLPLITLYLGILWGLKNSKNTVIVTKEIEKKFPIQIKVPNQPNPLTLEKISFDFTNEFYLGKKYPSQITNVPLAETKCSRLYSLNPENKDYIDNEGKGVTDIRLARFINKTNAYLLSDRNGYNDLIGGINNIKLCNFKIAAQLDQEFYIFQVQGSGGGVGRITFIQSPHEFYPVAEVHSPYAYASCELLVADTQDNAYFKCQGGDGPGGGASIQSLNLDTYFEKQIYECASLMDNLTCHFYVKAPFFHTRNIRSNETVFSPISVA